MPDWKNEVQKQIVQKQNQPTNRQKKASPWPWTVAECFTFGKVLGVVMISVRDTGCVYACRVGRKPIDANARQDVPMPRWYSTDFLDIKQALEAMEYWIENDKKTPRVYAA